MKFMISVVIFSLSILYLNASPPIESRYLAEPEEVQSDEKLNYRLSDDVIPSHYDILITPYFVNESSNIEFTFDGTAKISFKTAKANVSSIVLHIDRITIKSFNLKLGNQEVKILSDSYENATHKWTLALDKNLTVGASYELTVNYVGLMLSDMKGFYRSYYWENGVKKWLGSTQFQQTSARRAFPCFDEPGFKSTFQVTINRPKDYAASVSNTNLESSVSHPTLANRVQEKFKKTPMMSTYLLAFIVSGFKGNQNKDKSFGVYANPIFFNQTAYAMDIGQKELKALGDYFNNSYYNNDMEKMDMAAVPDFSAGAMENWGLLTYRETGLLYDPEITSTRSMQSIAAVITHEILHMWFGNLLTCKWWEHTWLNEGFARYFQSFGTHMVDKDFDLDLQFVIDQQQSVLQSDSSPSSPPMSNEVNSPSQVSGNFGSISYSKGASFLRMMRLIIGDDKFQEILRVYILENKFSSVVPEDLWSVLEKVVPNKNMKKILAPWTELPGYPLVTAHYTDNTIHVSQKRFLSNQKDHNDSTMYNVPITVASNGSKYDNTEPLFYLMAEDGEKGKEFKLNEKPKDYIIVNVQQAGYYRVNYDKNNWDAIGRALHTDNHDNIHVLNRAQIVDDLFNLARVKYIKDTEVFDIIDYLRNEKHYIPWLAGFNGLGPFSKRMTSKDDLELFTFYILDLTKNIYEHLTYNTRDSDRRIDIYNRVNVLTWNCKYGHEECLNKTKTDFLNYKDKGIAVLPDYRPLIYCNGIRQGGEAEFNFLMGKYTNSLLPAEQLNILQGLACAKDQKLVDKYMEFIVTDNIRSQDRSSAFTYSYSSNLDGYKTAFNYITRNFKEWSKTMSLTSTLSSVTDRFTSQEEIDQLKEFIASNKDDLKSQEESLNKIVKSAEDNLKWDSENLKELREYLKAKKNSAASVKIMNFVFLLPMFVVLYFRV